MLRLAATAQALEAAGLLVAAGFQVAEALSGHSSTKTSGIALALLEVLTAALLATIAAAATRLRPWSRTPGVLTQICVALLAVILLQGHEYGWGTPALVLALAGLAGFFTPSSLKALARPAPEPEPEPAKAAPRKPPVPPAAKKKAAQAAKPGPPSKKPAAPAKRK
jgi:hypothetical protein